MTSGNATSGDAERVDDLGEVLGGKAASDDVVGWFVGRLPDGWFTAAPTIVGDRDEIVVVGEIAAPAIDGMSADAAAAAIASRAAAFRDDTREARVRIAREAEHRFDRKVSWGVRCADRTVLYTTLAAPAMTRLRLGERQVLDTLIDAGVARSRSEALAWCVRLVGDHTGEWLGELREALEQVEAVRRRGPG